LYYTYRDINSKSLAVTRKVSPFKGDSTFKSVSRAKREEAIGGKVTSAAVGTYSPNYDFVRFVKSTRYYFVVNRYIIG
jgi:hypothetical protein